MDEITLTLEETCPRLAENAWRKAPNYAGETYYGYYALLSRHRDSDIAEKSNFQAAVSRLTRRHDEDEDAWIIVRSNHWAVGWVEVILIWQNAPSEIAFEAEDMLLEISQHPLLDEQLFSDMESEAVHDWWLQMSLKERIELCAQEEESIFAARRNDDIPDGVFYYLLERIDA